MDTSQRVEIHKSISSINKEQYNSIVDDNNPFLEYEFLEALEDSGCVGPRQTWIPRYIILKEDDTIIGATTSYIKLDSYGEYIFDWEWARAFDNVGLHYYPKIVVAIPFTPANGTRILVHPEYDFEQNAEPMVKALIKMCRDLNYSSIHYLFLTPKERDYLAKFGFLSRKTHQYHWHNRSYTSFDDFLDDLRSGRKKQIRKERKSLYASTLEIELVEKDDIKQEHIDAMWEFYMDTHSRKWGSAYLNREFFQLMFENFRHRLVLVLAKDKDQWVGGTFNIVKNRRLYGRYWGAINKYDNLHFECCFYRLIDYSIKNGIEIFEAGAQGEHKFLRGFGAVPTYSSHYFADEGANLGISEFLREEGYYTDKLINEYNRQSPLKYLRSNKGAQTR